MTCASPRVTRPTLARRTALTTDVAIVVSAEDDAEIRRVTLTNLGSRSREIDVTSYAELALARRAADIAHPAFQKLFIQTEYDPRLGALLATRRPRAADDPRVWAAHVSAVEEVSASLIQ